MVSRILLPNTTISVSRLSFGTGSLHHLFSSKSRHALLAAAADLGVTHFDTSPYYGYGLAECDIGRFMLRQRGNFTLTTKIGLYPFGPPSTHITTVLCRKLFGAVFPRLSLPEVNMSVDFARLSFYRSLKRLKTHYVDFLLLHEPLANLLDTDEMVAWLEGEKHNGRLRYWGVAGLMNNISSFVFSGNPIASVVQTKDSLDQRQADFLLSMDRDLQFTYGYMSGNRARLPVAMHLEIIQAALARNTTGSLIFSSRSLNHVQQLSKLRCP